jgi:hypothetical protein
MLGNICQVYAEALLADGSRDEAEQQALRVEKIFATSSVKVPQQIVEENLRFLMGIYEKKGDTGKAALYRQKMAARGHG